MSMVNNTSYVQAAYQSSYSYSKTTTKTTSNTKEVEEKGVATEQAAVSSGKKVDVSGATYGSPKLSQKALDYYNELKKKYGSLSFVLVSSDKKQEAEMMKGSFGNSKNLTVLIDTDKIEKMATDEKYRKQYEGIIAKASVGVLQMGTQLGSMAKDVKSYGMSVDKTGITSYFAEIKKSSSNQKKILEKRSEEKLKAKKEAERKAQKKQNQERLEGKRADKAEKEETVTITANSVEELARKIQEYYQNDLFNNVKTDSEKTVGSQMDFKL